MQPIATFSGDIRPRKNRTNSPAPRTTAVPKTTVEIEKVRLLAEKLDAMQRESKENYRGKDLTMDEIVKECHIVRRKMYKESLRAKKTL